SGNSGDFEKKIKDFEAKFPGEPITDILRKYERFATLSLAEQYKSSDRTEKIARARRLIEENTVFLARFNVGGEDPFAELRRDLTEYNMLSGEILKKRSEIENFGVLHSIGEDAEGIATMTLEEIEENRHRLDGESAELAREIALTDRACTAYADALEERDELVMKRLELEELLKKQEENYNIILLTKKYLTEARENMTVRYLGKTKSSFEHYAKEIGGGNEEFIMSTDFGVSRLDGGVTKDTEAYSRGTRDLYNLAARLALVDSLYEGEKPFIVLDDPFCSFDDKKTAAALKLLKASAKERQIIYFTCSKSREA
ncbi:MAG: hypothetical protein IKY62_00170, partial [Clostridia bacterium]|nr:hypothetical protein [Clostridia bacterium]